MLKKLTSLLTLLLVVSSVMCACGQHTPSNDDTQHSQPPAAQTTPTDPSNATEPEEPTMPHNPTEPVLPPVIPQDKPVMTPAQALYGSSSSGYSIWTIPVDLNSVKRICVDLDGYQVFEMDGSELDVAGVHHGGVLLMGENGRYFLRSVPSGDLVFNSVNEEGIRIILPQCHGKEMFRDGYVLAVKPRGTTYEIGILNPKGEWIIPLGSDFAILPYLKADLTLTDLEKQIVYLGEGVIGMLCKDDVYRYYNMVTKTMVTPQLPKNLSKQTVYDALKYHVCFADGLSQPVFMNNNYYLFYSSGKVEAFNVLWPKGLPRAKKCGEGYFDRATKTAYFLYDYGSGILVCDSGGKILKKHEGISLVEYNYRTADGMTGQGFAADGYARILLKYSDETICYGVLDINGEFLFEPVSLSAHTNSVFDPDGYRLDLSSTSGYGFFTIVDHQGRVCYESEFVKGFNVKNHVFYFNDGNQDVYIHIEAPVLY